MNLYICTTPLQLFITEYLLNNINKEKSLVLIIPYSFNDKYLFYSQRLFKCPFVKTVNIIKINNKNTICNIFNFVKLYNWLITIKRSKIKFKNIYFASIDNFYIHFLLSHLNFIKFYTFDDGTINIVNNSNYKKKNQPVSLTKRILKKLLNIKIDINTTKNNTSLHYTIYKDMPNITHNVEFINIFDKKYSSKDNKRGKNNQNKRIGIFLGQPFKEKNLSVNTYLKLKNEYNIENIYYYIHPREDFETIQNKIPECDIIRSPLIIEEYIMQLSNLYGSVSIYTISSSAGFNFHFSKIIEVYFIIYRTRNIEELLEIYSLIEKNNFNTLIL